VSILNRNHLLTVALGLAILAAPGVRAAGDIITGEQPAKAGEILTNENLVKLLEAGVALDVVLQKVATANCQFDDSSTALIEIQSAGKKGGWTTEDVRALQKRVMEVANAFKKTLRELAVKAVNTFDNAPVETSAGKEEYELMMRTLVRQGGKPLVPYLMSYMEEESERKRAGVVDALGRLGDRSAPVLTAVTNMLFDRSKPVRLETAKAVAALRSQNTAEELIQRLNSRTQKLDGVAMALGFIGDSKAVDPLTTLLRQSGDSDTRVCAAFALGELRARTNSASEVLLDAVLDERDAALRSAAARSLSLVGEKRTPAYIVRAFQRYRQGREELIGYLASFKDPTGIQFLIEQVDADDPAVKRAAREALSVVSGGENYETGEEWRGWWEVNKVRPDFMPLQASEPRLPDARREATPRRDPEDLSTSVLK